MDFTGKVVLVTGASGGVGGPTARLFASLNASLALVGRNQAKLKEIADHCRKCKGKQPLSIEIDLTHEGSCESVIQKTLEAFGRLDVLVNCAGRISLNSMFDENIDGFDELFKINLRVPYKLTHCALPYLVQTKGNVVNISAQQFDVERPGFLNVSVINSAVERFTKAAAIDVAEAGVRINAVSVLFAETDLMEDDSCDDVHKEDLFDDLACQYEVKILEPEKVAKMIAIVASDRYPRLNGAHIYNI